MTTTAGAHSIQPSLRSARAPVTATMTTTAGAHSIQPSLRSARAPSDSCGLRFLVACSAPVPEATSVVVLIGPFLPSRPADRLLHCRLLRRGSRDQSLRLQGVVEQADHRFLCACRVDAGRR